MALLSPGAGATAAGGAAAARVLDECSWERPGANPFRGDVIAAIDDYADIPASTRARLKARMSRHAYDDLATIGRDEIVGAHHYAPDIRQMHFGVHRLCNRVTRSRWPAGQQERGPVYCEDGICIIVPTVCHNVSRVTRVAEPAAAATPPDAFDDLPPTAAGPPPALESAAVPDAPPDIAAAEPYADDPAGPLIPFGPGGGGGGGPGGGPPPISAVPEPGWPALWFAGLVTLVAAGRRNARRAVLNGC